jgi:DMSO/TMAO reductase YedYZ molybdopterin-dependent catalytic subunit
MTMSFFRKLSAALILLSILAIQPALAEDAMDQSVMIAGQIKNARQLTVDDLRKMPATTVSVSFVTGHGPVTGTFSGVLLWTLLSDAVLVDGPGKGAALRHVIAITGQDGYSVALSFGELSPDFEGKSVILALTKDGKPLDPKEGIRLVVPGDKHAGRSVRGVLKITVQ